MGYDLHITRREQWFAEGPDITAEEWLAYVQSDPELHPVPENGPHFVTWSGPSTIEEPWLDWFEGCISAKYPDRALIGKMLTIAHHFGATVQGDDGETYDDASEIPSAAPAQASPNAWERLPFWKQFLILILIGCVLLAFRILISGP